MCRTTSSTAESIFKKINDTLNFMILVGTCVWLLVWTILMWILGEGIQSTAEFIKKMHVFILLVAHDVWCIILPLKLQKCLKV